MNAQNKKKDKKSSWLPETIEMHNQQGKVIGKEPLDKAIFDGYINQDLMHQAIQTYLANKRQGTVATKTRGLVSGGGKKPWRQKGTGRARFGSIRTPIWRHGGTVFGPQPRDYSRKFPKRMNVQALKSALNAKLKDAQIVFIDDVQLKQAKTKDFSLVLKNLKISEEKALILKKNVDNILLLSSRNIPTVAMQKASSVNTYSLMNCKKLVLTKDALEVLKSRIQGKK